MTTVREVSDDALLAGLGAGDADAAAAFVRRFQHRVFGVALSVTNDRALADDVAQETFVRAWRHAGAYDARRGAVVPWLLTIARNAAIDAVRARRRRPIELDSLPYHPTDPSPGPDERATLDDEVARVRRALGELPESQRRAVMLATYAGRTAQEIGAIDEVPLGTAKTRIRAGLIRLRDALDVTAPDSTEPRGCTP